MITDYHIQLIVGKMDKLLEVQNAMLDELRKMVKRPPELEQLKQTMESIMEEQKETIPETPQSVTITQDTESSVSLVADEKSATVNEKPKRFNKTQAFKDYQAAGGKLSWNKWKAAGMPLTPDLEPAK